MPRRRSECGGEKPPERKPRREIPERPKREITTVPFDPINECVMLAAVIVDVEAANKYLPTIPADSFFGQGHAPAWAILQKIQQRGLHYDPATVQQMSGGAVSTEMLEAYVAERPRVPPNIRYHAECISWDRARIEAVRGPVSAFLEAIKDPSAEPSRVRALARAIGDSFDGVGDRRFLRDSSAILREHKQELEDRRMGRAIYPYGIEGLDFYGPDDPEPMTSRLIPGMAPGKLTVIVGLSGCLSGSTKIGVNRLGKNATGSSNRYCLRDLVHRFNGGNAGNKYWDPNVETRIRCRYPDGSIRLNRLVAAYESGEKLTYCVETAKGWEIQATAEHRFLTANGWKCLRELVIGEMVWVERKTQGVIKSQKPKRKRYPVYCGLVGHPRATTKNRTHGGYTVPRHILVVEADMNALSVSDYIVRLRQGNVDGLVFLDSSLVVHHMDRNRANYDLKNLEVLTRVEHSRRHADYDKLAYWTELDRVVSIAEEGVEMTYDLLMEAPHHNFIANGFVVHNSGKSTVTARIALEQARQGRSVLYGAWEQTAGLTLELIAAMSLGWDRSDLMTGKFTEADQAELLQEMDRLTQWLRFLEVPYDSTDTRRTNASNLNSVHQYIADVVPDVFIADLFKRALTETKPDDEEIALWRVQAIAQQTRTHVMLVHQLRLKDVESRPDQRPTRESVKGNSAWIDVADTLIGWYRPSLHKNVPDDTIQAIILKQRYGEWPLAIEFDWNARYGSVDNGRSIEYERPGQMGEGMDGFLGESFLKNKGKRKPK